MTGHINWNNESGFWQVTDECGNVWDVVDIDDGHANLQREDSQRYYGATWSADADGSERGGIASVRDGDTYNGVDTRYTFSEMSGWDEQWHDDDVLTMPTEAMMVDLSEPLFIEYLTVEEQDALLNPFR